MPPTHQAPRGHEHLGAALPGPDVQPDPPGRTVDRPRLSRLLGAAMDQCVPCQDELLSVVSRDATSTARLVEIALVAQARLLGGISPELADPDRDTLAARSFRVLAAAGLRRATRHELMYGACDQMSPADRRAALDTALDLLVGQATLGLPGIGL